MKENHSVPDDDVQIVSSFQSLRQTLLDEKFADRLDKTLAYWALPNDRRLPLAFLGRTIKDLLSTPFEELSATPGIGEKKIHSLVKLLSRATKDQPPAVPFGVGDEVEDEEEAEVEASVISAGRFDPTVVSEALWSQWQETVREHGIGHEKLGRLAPTLQRLPTVIWHTPLNHYVNLTVAQIRQLKTHGEKRVRAILEVFFAVHELLSNTSAENHLTVRMMPKFIEPIEHWATAAFDSEELPSAAEVRKNLTIPLLEQIRVDAGDTIYDLAKGRLGIDGPPQSVRLQAKQRNVTRARVYQLLEDCGNVMDVRWPEGKDLLTRLATKARQETEPRNNSALLLATVELFYPSKKIFSEDEFNALVDSDR